MDNGYKFKIGDSVVVKDDGLNNEYPDEILQKGLTGKVLSRDIAWNMITASNVVEYQIENCPFKILESHLKKDKTEMQKFIEENS